MFNTEISKHVVRASTVITGTYVAGTVFSAGESNYLGILIEYTKGSETTIEVKLEASGDGTTFGQQTSESASSGTVTVDLAERKLTGSGNYIIDVYPFRNKTIRISVKSTGGSPTGTVAVTAFTSWA